MNKHSLTLAILQIRIGGRVEANDEIHGLHVYLAYEKPLNKIEQGSTKPPRLHDEIRVVSHRQEIRPITEADSPAVAGELVDLVLHPAALAGLRVVKGVDQGAKIRMVVGAKRPLFVGRAARIRGVHRAVLLLEDVLDDLRDRGVRGGLVGCLKRADVGRGVASSYLL